MSTSTTAKSKTNKPATPKQAPFRRMVATDSHGVIARWAGRNPFGQINGLVVNGQAGPTDFVIWEDGRIVSVFCYGREPKLQEWPPDTYKAQVIHMADDGRPDPDEMDTRWKGQWEYVGKPDA